MSDKENRSKVTTNSAMVEESAYHESAMKQLEAVIEETRRQKKWSAPLSTKARELFTKVLRIEPMETVAPIGVELHTSVFEPVIHENWQKMTTDDKQRFVDELLKINTEKGVPKHLIVADNLARSGLAIDQQLALKLLHASVGMQAKGEGIWPKLPKYKVELLQKRFLFSSAGWPELKEDDLRKAKILLAAFTEAADDSKVISNAKNKTSFYGFARWAGSILQRLSQDDPATDLMRTRLLSLGASLPEWSNEVTRSNFARVLPQVGFEETVDPHVPQSNTSISHEVDSVKLSPSPSLPPDQNDTQPIRRVRQQPSEQNQTHPGHAAVNAINSGIESLKVGLDLLNKLSRDQQRMQKEKEKLEEDLIQAQQQITGLRSANAKIEQSLIQITQQCEGAQTEVKRFKSEVESLRTEVEEERAGRAEDEKRFAEQIEREKQFVLNGFKGKLRSSLHLIFDNKRTTDHHELSPELAGFYKRWFNEVEEKLKAAGIQVN